MAEDLADGEFWLPSQFLTDDDIVSDFFGSTSETSDEEINILNNSNLKNINFFVPVSCAKAPVRSVSPQSTLFAYEQGSSHGSPSEKAASENESPTTATLELLNEAACEVAKMKLKTDKRAGTGFFDCSKKPVCASAPVKPAQIKTPTVQPPYYPPPLFRQIPATMRTPIHLISQPQHKATKNNTRSPKTGISTRPLGLPQSAWPPLPGQSPTQEPAQAEPVNSIFVGPPKNSVGTGVFLPRQIVSLDKPEEIPKKSKNNKRSQQRRNRTSKANDDEIQLPSEWVY